MPSTSPIRSFVAATILLPAALHCPANAAVYKCVAIYPGGVSVSLSVLVPEVGGTPAALIYRDLNNDRSLSIDPGEVVFVGQVEYNLYRGLGDKPMTAPFFVTNQRPLIGFFRDRLRIANVRIDLNPNSPKVTFYDAFFAPEAVATGTCS